MSQLDFFSQANSSERFINITNGQYCLINGFFERSEAIKLFDSLLSDISWKQEEMNIYGRIIKFPRLTAWYGDRDKPYSFSGIQLNPEPWTEALIDIKKQIEAIAETSFNSVLLNLYRDGNDSISWHTDAEKELGKNPTIASVNFGASRKFQLRHKVTKEKRELILENGSLLIMKGELQHFWQHQVPKTKKPVDKRINLTFRTIY